MSTETVELATPDGPTKVSASLVGEHFAVHRNPQGLEIEPWRVTHRPTGKRMPGSFWTEEHATRYAEELSALDGADWSSTTGPWPAGERVLPIKAATEEADRKAWCSSPLPGWPKTEAEATADKMARYYAMTAQDAYLRQDEVFGKHVERGQPGYEEHLADTWNASAAFVTEWSALRLLRALIKHAPDKADEVAADLWSALESGDALGEWLWEWLVIDYRIDPAAIAERRRLYQDERERRKAQRAAETESATAQDEPS